MVYRVQARSVASPLASFQPATIERRALGEDDVLVSIQYAGICHSDIHHARSEFGHSIYPMVPGHEIAGTVMAVGSRVTRFEVGDRAAVGCFVGSCGQCESCLADQVQHCQENIKTYNSIDRDGLLTMGGFSEAIVVDQAFVFHLPDVLDLAGAASLLCAGSTMYSPLRRWNTGPHTRVAIIGLGGLGHLGVKISRALGAMTTVFDLSSDKRSDALRMGADDFRVPDAGVFKELTQSFDLIVSTVPSRLDMDGYLGMLSVNGVFVIVGILDKPMQFSNLSLMTNSRAIAGARVGGVGETQQMLDFCAKHGISAEVEVISANEIDDAFNRVVAGDVRYRFVIDISTMAEG